MAGVLGIGSDTRPDLLVVTMTPGTQVTHRGSGLRGMVVWHYGDGWWEFLPDGRPARASLTCHETELADVGEDLELDSLLWEGVV